MAATGPTVLGSARSKITDELDAVLLVAAERSAASEAAVGDGRTPPERRRYGARGKGPSRAAMTAPTARLRAGLIAQGASRGPAGRAARRPIDLFRMLPVLLRRAGDRHLKSFGNYTDRISRLSQSC